MNGFVLRQAVQNSSDSGFSGVMADRGRGFWYQLQREGLFFPPILKPTLSVEHDHIRRKFANVRQMKI